MPSELCFELLEEKIEKSIDGIRITRRYKFLDGTEWTCDVSAKASSIKSSGIKRKHLIEEMKLAANELVIKHHFESDYWLSK
jgi:hypothetical protein